MGREELNNKNLQYQAYMTVWRNDEQNVGL